MNNHHVAPMSEPGVTRPGTTAADICIGSNVNWLVSFGVPRETAQRCTEQLAAAVRAEERERIAAEFADLIADAEPVICADEDPADPVAPPTLAVAVVDIQRVLAGDDA